VFFAGLYGCPALLAREVVRRPGRGWPSLLLLAAALAVLEAGAIDQSFFAEENDLVRGWSKSVRRTYVDPLGISAFNALSFTLGHIIHSFAAPIAVAEALRADLAHQPWLRRRGIIVASLAWLLTVAAITTDLEPGHLHNATGPEVLGTLAVVALLVGIALRPPATRPNLADLPPIDHRHALVAGFVVATAIAVAPDTWLGLAALVITAVLAVGWLAWSARTRRWTVATAAAAAVGALTSRGTLGFLYEPLVGEVSLPAKIAHNIVMLLAVLVLGTIAIRRASAGQPTPRPGSR
jgi:hypothetical protein